MNTGEINTVCLALGPYRNLTTLTAAMIALHPRCQVLNHAGERVFANRRVNFLDEYSDEKFEAFIRHAVKMSRGGTRGQYGGSILHSHAFGRDAVRRAYETRFGKTRRKSHIQSVFWKESLLTSNYIRTHQVDLDAIFAANPRLRFLMPVRNPMDCAVSNLNRGRASQFEGLTAEASLEEVLGAILREFAWFLAQHDRNPDRFFYFLENEFDRESLLRLADFLGVESDPEWLEAATGVYRLEGAYTHAAALRQAYGGLVREIFGDRAEIRDRLLAFAGR